MLFSLESNVCEKFVCCAVMLNIIQMLCMWDERTHTLLTITDEQSFHVPASYLTLTICLSFGCKFVFKYDKLLTEHNTAHSGRHHNKWTHSDLCVFVWNDHLVVWMKLPSSLIRRYTAARSERETHTERKREMTLFALKRSNGNVWKHNKRRR